VLLLWELRLEVSMCSENATQKPVIAFNKYRARHIKDIGNVVQSVSSTGIEHVVNRVVYCATGTEIYISAG
jgi:hypothetical protein